MRCLLMAINIILDAAYNRPFTFLQLSFFVSPMTETKSFSILAASLAMQRLVWFSCFIVVLIRRALDVLPADKKDAPICFVM